MGGHHPPLLRRPPSAGRAQLPPSSGVPASTARPRQKGDANVSQTASPMSSRAALEPAPASASRRPRCLPSSRRGPPARASIRVLVCGSRVAVGARAGPSPRRAAAAAAGGGLLRGPEVGTEAGRRARARRHFPSLGPPEAVGEGERCRQVGGSLGAGVSRAGGFRAEVARSGSAGGGWAPRGAAGPNPLRFPPSASRTGGRGHSSHSSPRPSPHFNQTWAGEIPPSRYAHWPALPPAVA